MTPPGTAAEPAPRRAWTPDGIGRAPTYAEMELRGAVATAVRGGRAVDVPALLADYSDLVGDRERARAIIADETARATAERAERERRAAADFVHRRFHDADAAIARKERGEAPDREPPARVQVQANNRQFPEITAEAVAALRAWNDPPSMFIRSGDLVRVDTDEHGRPVIRPVLDNHLRWALGEAADFVAADTDSRGTIIRPTIPPMPVARNILSSAHLCSWFPPLLGILGAPAICPDGRLVTAPGYDPGTGLYYSPGPDLDLPPVPGDPTPGEVADAAALVCDAVADFPFVVEKNGVGASRANAVAALMTPIVRPMIAGRVPMLLLDKPQMGTGASLLAELIVTIATGSSAAMTQAPTARDEWGKLLLSELSAGRAVIVFDNLTGVLSSSELSTAITQRVYNGRVLGKTQTLRVENQPCWIATGINIALGGDLPRRCVWVRMDPQDARPWLRDRSAFRHPDLLAWATRERGRIIAAVLTIARAWIRDGRRVPGCTPRLAVFENWCEVLGGMLSVMKVDGFLGNLDQQYEEAEIEAPQWGAFLERWHERFGEKPVTVAELIDELERNASALYVDQTMRGCAPDEVLEAIAVRGRGNQKLGQLLRYRKDTRYPSGFMLARARASHRSVQWVVLRAASEQQPGQATIEQYAGESAGSG
ncbi:MAG: hypothetical protein ABFC89_00955 [Methanospirillum sp.]